MIQPPESASLSVEIIKGRNAHHAPNGIASENMFSVKLHIFRICIKSAYQVVQPLEQGDLAQCH